MHSTLQIKTSDMGDMVMIDLQTEDSKLEDSMLQRQNMYIPNWQAAQESCRV